MSVRDYCERSGPGFWAEPVNALSNVAFLLAAVIAFRRWRHVGGNDLASLGLIAVVAAGGLGSFGFHALATLGAAVLDVGPIAVFICSYLAYAASVPATAGLDRCQLPAWLRGAASPCTASRPNGHLQRFDRLRSGARRHGFGRRLGTAARAHRACPRGSRPGWHGAYRGAGTHAENCLVVADDGGGICHVAGVTID
jgi:hypothetical protein